jgi:hypothetical protein
MNSQIENRNSMEIMSVTMRMRKPLVLQPTELPVMQANERVKAVPLRQALLRICLVRCAVFLYVDPVAATLILMHSSYLHIVRL